MTTATPGPPLYVTALAPAFSVPKAPRPCEPTKLRLWWRQRLLAACDRHEPRTWKELASLAGLPLSSRVRADLAELRRQGKVARVRGELGYVLAADES